MGSEWFSSAIADLPIFIGDGNYSSKYPKSSDFVPSGVPFITASDFSNGRISSKNFRFITTKQHLILKKGHIKQGDVLVVTRGNGIGDVAWVESQFDDCNINAQLVLLRADEKILHNKYLYYLLSSKEYKDLFVAYSSGSAQPQLPHKALKLIELRYPPFKEQKSIAHILGSLDDKIELNRRMNATLEAMAQALFKSWFVDFDPVIDNALAAGHPIPEPLQERAEARAALGDQRQPLPETIRQQFPNRFVCNEDMGWVPEEWVIGTLLDYSELISGGTPKTSNKNYWDGDIPWASAKDISQCNNAILHQTERNITQVGLANSSTKLVGNFSTIIVSRGATTGRMAMAGGDFAMNQTCYALRSKFNTHFYQYSLIKDVIARLVNAAHGSIFDTITTTTFQSTRILLPPIELARKFDSLASTYFLKLDLNQKQLINIKQLRDTLLPKLLSGQLRIPEAEQQVADML